MSHALASLRTLNKNRHTPIKFVWSPATLDTKNCSTY